MSICTVMGEGSKVLVGRDIRLGGEIIEHLIVAGLLNSGCRPVMAGLTPTPALQLYIAKRGGFDAGLMVTASHNPPQYNGVKLIMGDGVEASREVEERVEEVFYEERFRYVTWREADISATRINDVNSFYVSETAKLVDIEKIRKRQPRVVIDAANNVGVLTLPEIAKRVGAKPLVINGNLDPHMSGREPEPTPESLREASIVVTEMKADIGIGTDGDADRAIVIDERGEAHWGDRTAVVLAPFLKEKHPELPSRVFTGVSSSSFVEDILKEHRISVVWLKVGSPIISRTLIAEGGLMGFEENGGIMYPVHHPVRDSGAALVLLLELLATKGMPISALYSSYPKTYTIKTKVPSLGVNFEKMYRAISSHFSGYRQIDLDGIKIVAEDHWALIRPSGTEPVVRIMVESTDEEKARELLRVIKQLIEDARL